MIWNSNLGMRYVLGGKMSDRKEEISNFSEEVLGVNFRSFRTLRDLLIRPKKVFDDFQNKAGNYTPTLRLALLLLGIALALYYFVGGYEKFNAQMILDQGQAQDLIETYGREKTEKFLETTMGIYKFSALPAMIASAFPMLLLISLLKKNLSLGYKINFLFGAACVSFLAAIVFMPVQFLVKATPVWLYVLIYWTSYFFFALTIFRGSRDVLYETTLGGIIKSVLITAIYALLSLVLILVFTVIGMIIVAPSILS